MTHINYYDQDSSFITASKEYPVIAYYSKWANDWPDVLQDAIDNDMTFEEYVEYVLNLEEYDFKHGICKLEDTTLLKRISTRMSIQTESMLDILDSANTRISNQ
jgi:hypothetical protein